MIDFPFVIAGALTGFVVGLTGVGGGALMTPLLTLLFGVAPLSAVATDLWFAAVTKIVAVRIHNDAHQVDWQIVRTLWIGSLPIALLTVVLMGLHFPIHHVSWFSRVMGAAVLLTAISLIFAPRLKAAALRRANADTPSPGVKRTVTIVSGALLGLCVALTSVGAGAIGSVILLYVYPERLPPHKLVATDLAHSIPLALVAGTGYLVSGFVDWHTLMNLLVGSIPAVILGSVLSRRFSQRWLRLALAVVLFGVGIVALR